jgi:small subunit ribosomal protein S17
MNSDKTKKIISRQFIGTVVSTAMNKTIVVNVEKRKLHPKYKKYYRVSRKYHVHDEKGAAKVGEKVVFVECRPISKTKRWRLAGAAK